MQEITLNSKNYLLVEVPDDAHTFREKLGFDGAGHSIMFEPRIEPYLAIQSIRIGRTNPNDKFQIIGKISDIIKDEDICKGLVEFHNYDVIDRLGQNLIMYKDYNFNHENEELFDVGKATDSFLSYLQSIDLDMTKQYLLIQKL